MSERVEIITTHEQADFDGVASMFAVWLMDTQKTVVLPSRVNRNVAHFLKDYKNDFPTLGWTKIPQKKIDLVVLVDTQSCNEKAQITDQTVFQVIDHHQPRLNLPDTWKCHFEHTGACATILIEELQNKGITPSAIFCSLLMMGVYEDTGNLSYGNTNVRDIHAAAWLMENGADLDLLHRYLNPPLSDEQKALCDLLLQNCKTLRLMGQEIIIAEADARTVKDEFSTVAHVLRDMMSPDALFIILQTRAGIRLIGRATNDRINVGQIMKHFNGGGHSRAAAGIIIIEKDQDCDAVMAETKAKLLDILPGFVTPPLSVGQIMSSKPLTIQLSTPVKDIVELIRRYGYEGYPVTDENGNLMGLLNRRSVDKDQEHQLNLTVESMMEPGDYAVKVDDPIDYLKEMMNISGWGQIPVVSENRTSIIGIVTRTDLIKTLAGDAAIPGSRNFARNLEEALPAEQLALIRMVAKTAENCQYAVYIVGGFVRDLILDEMVMDFDIVVEGDAIHLAHTLVNIYGGKVRTHSRFGTAKWIIQDIKESLFPEQNFRQLPDSLDLISARTEFYDYPTALPHVERSSIKLDLHRRDFTINTLALRLDGDHFGDLLDFWGGYNDISSRLIRVLHSLSFIDDPTRMLRAIRFEQRFGFTLEAHTQLLLSDAVGLLKQVSGRRILHELELIFHEENPLPALERLDYLGILKQIHPAIFWDSYCSQRYEHLVQILQEDFWHGLVPDHSDFICGDGKYLLWWGEYSAQSINEICERLQLSQKTRKILLGSSSLYNELAHKHSTWPSEITLLFDMIPIEALYITWCLSSDMVLKNNIYNYVNNWRNVQPFTKGDDLKKLDFVPGEWITEVLRRLRCAWIDEEVSSESEEKKLLKQILPLFTKNVKHK